MIQQMMRSFTKPGKKGKKRRGMLPPGMSPEDLAGIEGLPGMPGNLGGGMPGMPGLR
jgi:hypothetical protein